MSAHRTPALSQTMPHRLDSMAGGLPWTYNDVGRLTGIADYQWTFYDAGQPVHSTDV